MERADVARVVSAQEGAERMQEMKLKDKESEKIPDDLWVQCDFPKCLRWRRLPGGTDPSKLPEMWFCYLHPDPVIAEQSHSYPEEKYDGGRSADMADEGGFSLKDAKKKFEMHKKVPYRVHGQGFLQTLHGRVIHSMTS